jgi:hypothetical protein
VDSPTSLVIASRFHTARFHNGLSTAIGHAGRLVIGKLADLEVAIMSGRVHL